ncbi:hypothetical protein AX769_05030 [Frondihabitans sp. PAMC 28766]|uniref:acyl-CoA-like ligand-binding transcription factor n=1 Tax=Frondihabitans sp. PAMC 28766 TaxID=1795630 RepID=UPI00078ECC0B|nr:TetR family transcriptional regulator [Frondihabitans sp. PAMC 28766]AMM19619.1 hypothetical protein AX769_05030 [Frondihabitans sp. PAMC 28766]
MVDEPKTAPVGRPRAAEPSDVAALALRLFAERGFDETTMKDVAQAAGISRQTLFRYFPSKFDIVWDRYQTEYESLERALRSAPGDEPLLDALCRIAPATLEYRADEMDLLRTQVRLIDSVPSAEAHVSERIAEYVAILSAFIERRTGLPADSLYPQLVSRLVWTTSWTALVAWAASDDATPNAALAEAFELFRTGLAAPPTDA